MKPGLVIMSLWTVGASVIILLAALQEVPEELLDAARVDGAGWWHRLWHVTLPIISPAIYFIVVVDTIASLQSFTEAYTAFFGAGNTTYSNDAALFYAIYLFQQAFEFLHMGYASALAMLLFVIVMLVTAVQVRLEPALRPLRREASTMTAPPAAPGRRGRPRPRPRPAHDRAAGARRTAGAPRAVRPRGRGRAGSWSVLAPRRGDDRVRLPVRVAGQRLAQAAQRRLRQPADPRDAAPSTTTSRCGTPRPMAAWLLNTAFVTVMATIDGHDLERTGGVGVRALPLPRAQRCSSAWCWPR